MSTREKKMPCRKKKDIDGHTHPLPHIPATPRVVETAMLSSFSLKCEIEVNCSTSKINKNKNILKRTARRRKNKWFRMYTQSTQTAPLKIPYTRVQNHTHSKSEIIHNIAPLGQNFASEPRNVLHVDIVRFSEWNKRDDQRGIWRTPSKYQTTLLTEVYNFCHYRHDWPTDQSTNRQKNEKREKKNHTTSPSHVFFRSIYQIETGLFGNEYIYFV